MRFLSLQNTAFPASGSLFNPCLKAEKTLPLETANTNGSVFQAYNVGKYLLMPLSGVGN